MPQFFAQLTVYKIILTLFFLFAWTRVLSRYLKGMSPLANLIAWTIIWGAGVYLLYLPAKAELFGRLLGATNGVTAVFTIAIIFLYYSVYRIYVKIEELVRELNRLTQASSIAHSVGPKAPTKKSRQSGR